MKENTKINDWVSTNGSSLLAKSANHRPLKKGWNNHPKSVDQR